MESSIPEQDIEKVMNDYSCLKCGAIHDAATAPMDPTAKPSDGDLSVCWKCGYLSAFTDDGKLRKLTPVELSKISASQMIQVARFQKAITRRV